MKLLYAPDTSDHPNWGCRFMGDWYRNALTALGAAPAWTSGSRWFFRQDPAVPAPATFAELQHCAQSVRSEAMAKVAETLARCDLVFINGENFIRPGTLKGRRLLMLAWLAKTVFAKPVVLTNLSLDLSEPALAELVAEVLPLLDEVHVREDASASQYRALVANARFRQFADVAWTTAPAPIAEWGALAQRDGHFSAWPDKCAGFDPFQPYLTLSASSVFALPEHARLDPSGAFAELGRRLAREVAPVVLVAPCEADSLIMRKVQAATGFPLLGLNLPVRQGIDVLGNARVQVGGRWHSGIFAATGGTPLVAFAANTHKMATLMRQLHPQDPVFDPLRLGDCIEAIVAQAKTQLQGGGALREQVLQRSRALRAQVAGNLDFVKERLGSSTVVHPAGRPD